MRGRTYIAIDLKSFYASVECVDRGLDPLTTNLVVADISRTEKTICLAVTPSLKAYGISGRARLFEVVQQVDRINEGRLRKAPCRELTGSSSNDNEVKANPKLALEYIVAHPRMELYMRVSSRIYGIYLKYIAPEDIHVYSVDEVFIDATAYLKTYGIEARDLAANMIRDVFNTTGITATAGIGTNMYLAKIAMDIESKHSAPDRNGVRIAELDEKSYRYKYWGYRPMSDFWRIGPGTVAKLESLGIYTMGDLARYSLYYEEHLFRLFGVNAELLIDHAWGWEPCTIADIKAYRPSSNSISRGQVLSDPYDFTKTMLIIKEMADLLSLELVEHSLMTDQIVLTIGYDVENIKNPDRRKKYEGPVVKDHYGRSVPKPAHGSVKLPHYTSSTEMIVAAATSLFKRIADANLLVRRLYIVAGNVRHESGEIGKQLDLFGESQNESKERNRQRAILEIRRKFGKNAILKGMDFEDGATTMERNNMVGGHKA